MAEEAEAHIPIQVAVTVHDSTDSEDNSNAGTIETIGNGASTSNDRNVHSEELKPKYFVPESFFVLKNKGASKGSCIFSCKCCFNKEISAGYKSRCNLRSHIKKKHNGSLSSFDDLCQGKDSRKLKKISPQSQAVSEATSSQQCNIKDIFGRSAPKRPTQQDLDLYITRYIVDSVLPFHHVTSSGFQNFMKNLAPNLTIKSNKYYASKSDQLFQSLVHDLKTDLDKVDHVCLTIDHWASHRKGYIGFTAHWYDNKQTRKHACLALRRIVGSCTFDFWQKQLNL